MSDYIDSVKLEKDKTRIQHFFMWLMAHPFKPTRMICNQHEKVGRNQLCPCGSEIKFKKCCGRVKNDSSIHLQREEHQIDDNRPGIGQVGCQAEGNSMES